MADSNNACVAPKLLVYLIKALKKVQWPFFAQLT